MIPRRKKLLLFAATLTIVITSVLCFLRNTEPRYDGKLLSEWILVLSAGSERVSKVDAENAIRHIGTSGVPYFVKWISMGEGPSKRIAKFNACLLWLGEKFHLSWKPVEPPSELLMVGSCQGFRILGSQASNAVPALAQILATGNDQPARYAAASLGYLGTPGVNPLRKGLTSSNPDERSAAAAGIGCLGTNAVTLIPLLITTLDDLGAREAACRSLRRLKLRPDFVIPALIAKLQNGNHSDDVSIADVLAGYGPLARPALPSLQAALIREATSDSSKAFLNGSIKVIERQPETNTTSVVPVVP